MSTNAETRPGRRLAVVAVVAGAVETGFSLIMGVGGFVLLPLFGGAAFVLGLVSLQRASLGQSARGMAVLAIVFALLGVGAVVLLLWFLSRIEFTF
jgi:hypothetical protein